MEYEKSNIGGWLALLLTTLVIRAIAYSADVVESISLLSKHSLPEIFSWIVFMEAAAALTVMLSIVYLINKDVRFRKTFIASLILYAIMISTMAVSAISYRLNAGEYISALFGIGFYAAIWTPYVYKSKRLSNRLDIKEIVAEVVT